MNLVLIYLFLAVELVAFVAFSAGYWGGVYDARRRTPKTADGVPVRDGMRLWEAPCHRGGPTKTAACHRVEVRPCDYASMYSTPEAALEADSQA